MHYVKRVLLPKEKILYWGKVTPAIYLPGFVFCGIAIACANYLPGLEERSAMMGAIYRTLFPMAPSLVGNYDTIITGFFFVIGVAILLNAYAIAFSTELAVTNRRVIAKYGITNTVTTEIDRQKIAGVVIRQSLLGQLLRYGRITLRGYAGDIAGMPPLSKPYDFQKYVNTRIRL